MFKTVIQHNMWNVSAFDNLIGTFWTFSKREEKRVCWYVNACTRIENIYLSCIFSFDLIWITNLDNESYLCVDKISRLPKSAMRIMTLLSSNLKANPLSSLEFATIFAFTAYISEREHLWNSRLRWIIVTSENFTFIMMRWILLLPLRNADSFDFNFWHLNQGKLCSQNKSIMRTCKNIWRLFYKRQLKKIISSDTIIASFI